MYMYLYLVTSIKSYGVASVSNTKYICNICKNKKARGAHALVPDGRLCNIYIYMHTFHNIHVYKMYDDLHARVYIS